MRRLGTAGLVAVACVFVTPVIARPARTVIVTDWTKAARQDIDAMHDVLKNNHPGGADPENPGFQTWLEHGRALAHTRAVRIGGYAGYVRALQYYANGFRDGHIWYRTADPARYVWPGFLTRLDPDGQTVVGATDDPSAPPAGAVLISCDRMSPDQLYARTVTPYFVNADIPHGRYAQSWRLLSGLVGEKNLAKRCVFKTGATQLARVLNWRSVTGEKLAQMADAALGDTRNATGLHTINGVTFITVASFDVFDKEADPIRTLIARLNAERAKILASPIVVIDVRGNGGGNSEWGNQIVKALWGEANLMRVSASFDEATEWRVSPQNIALTRDAAKRSRDAGLIEDADYRDGMADKMTAARAAGRPYVAEVTPPAMPVSRGSLVQPFTGKVYFLTDYSCASACLDFADLVVRMPGVVHIGLPTSADAVYIDNVVVTLPSGAGTLSYSLKVYRNRVRANNEWYTPRYLWTKGAMTDDGIATWVKSLP